MVVEVGVVLVEVVVEVAVGGDDNISENKLGHNVLGTHLHMGLEWDCVRRHLKLQHKD